jgi:hypothetical protein
MWPGNTADVSNFIPVIDPLRGRFDIARVCVVADRRISAETGRTGGAAAPYILGVRERRTLAAEGDPCVTQRYKLQCREAFALSILRWRSHRLRELIPK